MLNDRERGIWQESVTEYGPDYIHGEYLVPITVKTSYILQGVLDLKLAIEQNHQGGLLNDEQREIALGFCDDIISTKRANEIVRSLEFNISTENNGLYTILALPNASED